MSNSTRDRVLKTLLHRQRCTINELAEAVGINSISVRHHVNKLEAEGLIKSEEERHGVGRPRLVLSLTEAGMEQFPTRYLKLTLRMLEQLKETLPERMVGELFQKIARDMAEKVSHDLSSEDLPIEERLDLLKDLMANEGFTVNWEVNEDSYHIIEASCPYHHLGEDHPEICAVDQELIANIIDIPPTRVKCILNGDNYCKYVIPNPEQDESVEQTEDKQEIKNHDETNLDD
jgi:predicted ArsR family transcriptional regulator